MAPPPVLLSKAAGRAAERGTGAIPAVMGGTYRKHAQDDTHGDERNGSDPMNQEKIGRAAGIVWEHLRMRGENGVSLAAVKKIAGLRSDEAVAAIGWLAREGKLTFEGNGRPTVRLVETELSCRV